MEFKAVMYLKRFYRYLWEICHTLENRELWKAPPHLTMTVPEILQYDVAKFMLYVCSERDRLSEEYMLMYQVITGYEGDQDRLHDWLSRNPLYDKDFDRTVPLTFKIMTEGEQNAIARGTSLGTEESVTELCSAFFRMLGNVLLSDHMPHSSPDDIVTYRKTDGGFEREPYNTMQEFYSLIDRLISG